MRRVFFSFPFVSFHFLSCSFHVSFMFLSSSFHFSFMFLSFSFHFLSFSSVFHLLSIYFFVSSHFLSFSCHFLPFFFYFLPFSISFLFVSFPFISFHLPFIFLSFPFILFIFRRLKEPAPENALPYSKMPTVSIHRFWGAAYGFTWFCTLFDQNGTPPTKVVYSLLSDDFDRHSYSTWFIPLLYIQISHHFH